MRCGPAALVVSLAALLVTPAVAPAQIPYPPILAPPPPPPRPITAYFELDQTSPCLAATCVATVYYEIYDVDRPVTVDVDWAHVGAPSENFVVRSSARCAPGAGSCTLRSPAYTAQGVYSVAVRATDDAGESAATAQNLQVFSASAYKRVTSRVPTRRRTKRPTRRRGGGGHPLCTKLKPGEQCGAGRGRQTKGGGEKVSHKGWPAVTGVLWKVTSMGRGHRSRTGGPDNDELLGRHGHDRLNGMGGDDILWGDWDPRNNNSTQHDTLRGGTGNDWLYPSHGTSRVYGGPGRDYVWAYYGRGSIDCGPGTDKVRVRLNSRFSLRNCEQVEHFCGHGSDGHGGCLKPGEKRKATKPR